MAALTLTSGCGCINLRTSSFIIGYIDLMVTIIFSTITVVGIVAMSRVTTEGIEEGEKEMVVVDMVISSITLMYVVMMMAFTIALLVGLHKLKRKVLKVYSVAAAIFFLLDFVVFFVGFVEDYRITTIVTRIIFLILEAYSFLVIRSYYYEMKAAGEGVTYTTA